MPDNLYFASALASAVAITLALRAAPFTLKRRIKRSALLADVGRWMPLGAVTILAVYCLASIDLKGPTHGLPELAGVVAVAGVHWWRHNAVLSIVAGTTVCLVLTNTGWV